MLQKRKSKPKLRSSETSFEKKLIFLSDCSKSADFKIYIIVEFSENDSFLFNSTLTLDDGSCNLTGNAEN